MSLKTLFRKEEILESVSGDVFNIADSFYNSLLVETELQELEPEESEKYSRLKSLGFINASETRELAKKQTDVDTLKVKRSRIEEIISFYLTAVKVFGKDVILIPKLDFFKLMKKYHLACGTFDKYIGSIPADILKAVEKTNTTLELLNGGNFLLYKPGVVSIDGISFPYIDPTFSPTDFYHHIHSKQTITVIRRRNFSSDDITDKYLENLLRYPLATSNYYGSWLDMKTRLWITMNELAMLYGENISNVLTSRRHIEGGDLSEPKRLFICAPTNEMILPEIEEFDTRERQLTQDPFIFSDCLHDTILIYHSWGEEASDELLEKYKNLSEKLHKAAYESNSL